MYSNSIFSFGHLFCVTGKLALTTARTLEIVPAANPANHALVTLHGSCGPWFASSEVAQILEAKVISRALSHVQQCPIRGSGIAQMP